MNFQYVEIDEVYFIHQAIIVRAGTRASVRDFGLLHSAVERPRATYLGKDLYPNVFLKAAALIQSLCRNHAFTDGNKRTSWVVTKRFMYLNGYHLGANTSSVVDFVTHIDNSKPSVEKIASWLRRNSSRVSR